MAEKLLIRALKGGKNTRIVTLNGKKITKMPSSLERLPGLRTLDLQNNLISKVCPEINTLTQGLCDLMNLRTLDIAGNIIRIFPPGKWKISRNLHLVPLRILICSYKCFNQRGPNLFGIAQV
ncbi:Leucine-Rich Repeat-Containing Protein 69 [Manis pentadactyla]|nr:Leucine-Rich Repeat-Containing Protein 69 [Manis pentadactyla]